MKEDYRLRKAVVEVIRCKDCPYFKWEEGSNNPGWSKCKKLDKYIEHNNKAPMFPEWCPLEIGILK